MEGREMLKDKKSFVSVRLIVAIVVIVIIIVFGVNYVLGLFREEQVRNFQSDILLVQSKVELLKGNYDMDKEAHPLKGIQLSQLPENIDISEFYGYNVIAEEDYEKFYLLNDEALVECGLGELVDRYDGFFIVNYDNYEVVYSKGYENENGLWCFRVSEMNKVKTPINQESVEVSAVLEQSQSGEQENFNEEGNSESNQDESGNQNQEQGNNGDTVDNQSEEQGNNGGTGGNQSEVQENQDGIGDENNSENQTESSYYRKVRDDVLNNITAVKQNIANERASISEEMPVE